MKKYIKLAIITTVIFLVFGHFLCNYLYNSKYETYHSHVVYMNSLESLKKGTMQYEITYTRTLVKYEHLGDDISMDVTCNGKSIDNGLIITPQCGETLDFFATIKEMDSIPDVGSGSASLTLSTRYVQTKSRTVRIRVDESGHNRYKNAYAIFDVTFTVTPIIEDVEVGFWEVVLS